MMQFKWIGISLECQEKSHTERLNRSSVKILPQQETPPLKKIVMHKQEYFKTYYYDELWVMIFNPSVRDFPDVSMLFLPI